MIPLCLRGLKKFPVTLNVSDHDNYNFLGVNLDLQNRTIRSIFVELDEFCERLCSKPIARVASLLPICMLSIQLAMGSFRIYVPISANDNLVYKPDMILLDFLTFGLSVLQLNPVKMWRYLTANDLKRNKQASISGRCQLRFFGERGYDSGKQRSTGF